MAKKNTSEERWSRNLVVTIPHQRKTAICHLSCILPEIYLKKKTAKWERSVWGLAAASKQVMRGRGVVEKSECEWPEEPADKQSRNKRTGIRERKLRWSCRAFCSRMKGSLQRAWSHITKKTDGPTKGLCWGLAPELTIEHVVNINCATGKSPNIVWRW